MTASVSVASGSWAVSETAADAAFLSECFRSARFSRSPGFSGLTSLRSAPQTTQKRCRVTAGSPQFGQIISLTSIHMLRTVLSELDFSLPHCRMKVNRMMQSLYKYIKTDPKIVHCAKFHRCCSYFSKTYVIMTI